MAVLPTLKLKSGIEWSSDLLELVNPSATIGVVLEMESFSRVRRLGTKESHDDYPEGKPYDSPK